MPQHLADLWEGRGDWSHVCSCYMGWSYVRKTKTWVEQGAKPNPAMDYHHAQQADRILSVRTKGKRHENPGN